MMDNKDLQLQIKELLGDPLSASDKDIINQILSGKIKLVYGSDPVITEIVKKLNNRSKILEDIKENKKEIYSYIKKEINACEDEIECHEDEIRGYRSQIRSLENLKKDIDAL